LVCYNYSNHEEEIEDLAKCYNPTPSILIFCFADSTKILYF